MKKIFYAIAFLGVCTFAQPPQLPPCDVTIPSRTCATPAVTCDITDPLAGCNELISEHCYDAVYDNGFTERECIATGYICHLGINPGRGGGTDAMFFYLASAPTCDLKDYFLTNDSQMKTWTYYSHGPNVPATFKPSPFTKFFFNNDNFGGPLAMTVMGSFILSAYNHSDKVQIIYTADNNRKEPYPDATTPTDYLLNEHSGIRVLAIDVIK